MAALIWPWLLIAVALCAARFLPLEIASGRLIPEVISALPLVIIPVAAVFLLAIFWHRAVMAVVAGMSLALLAWWHVGFFVPSGSLSQSAHAARTPGIERSVEDGVMRIMTLNSMNGNADAEEVVSCIRENNVELLALQEVSWAFLDELATEGIYDLLPYVAVSEGGAWDNGGLNCLFSLAPLYDVNGDLLPTELSALCAGTVEVGGRTIRFVSCHPGSPHRGGQDLWNSGLETIGSLSDYDHTYVIMGDFNSTWNHARFRELLGTSFVDSSQHAGEGFHMTWPADIGLATGLDVPEKVSRYCPALIEIDHIVYAADAGIFVGDLETVTISGTDHMALLATLECQ